MRGGSPPPPYTVSSSANSASLSITHSDLSITVNGASVATTSGGDPGAPATFDIHRVGNTSRAITATLNTTGTNADPNASTPDYSYAVTGGSATLSLTGGSVSFPVGSSDVDIIVTPQLPTLSAVKTIKLAVPSGSNGQCVPIAGAGYGVNAALAGAVLTMTEPQLQTVGWVAQPASPLTSNPNPGGGEQIFPDLDPGSTTPRNLANFQAKLATSVAGATIYFRVIDVDDPSANATRDPATGIASDPEGIVDNESNLFDNRGDATPGLGDAVDSGTTDASGQVTIPNFKVSMQPGDNYRVVASLKPIGGGSYTAIQDDGFSAGIKDNTATPAIRLGSVPNTTTVMSDMLTVWRRLHVETDSMGPVSGNTVNGIVTRVDLDRSAGTMVIETDQPLAPGDEGRFVPGTVTINGISYPVIGQLVAASGAIKVVLQVTNPTTAAEPDLLSPFSLVDDDFYKDGDTLPMPNTIALTNAMADAYVKVLVNEPGVGTSENNVPFVANLNGTPDYVSAISAHWQSRALNANNFWVAYVLTAFEGPRANDGDPNTGIILDGTSPSTDASRAGGSIVFAEAINNEGGVNGDTFDVVVEHEVGHAVANSGVEPVTGEYLTASPDSTDPADGNPDRYLLGYLNAIRNAIKPRS